MGKLRMGVIGLGMGRGHARGYHGHPQAELVAVCDPDAERTAAVQQELGVPRTYADAQEMLRVEDLDAVSVAVPSKFHAPLTIAALQRGLHVLCEKPMAMTVAASQRMQAAAEKAGRNLMINFSFRFTEAAFALKQQVENGVVGVYGDKGGLAHKNVQGGYDFVAEVTTDEGGDQFTKKRDWRTGTTPSSYHEFVDSILQQRPPLATGEQGIKVMKILEGIYKSAASGREVRYRPA